MMKKQTDPFANGQNGLAHLCKILKLFTIICVNVQYLKEKTLLSSQVTLMYSMTIIE